MNPIRFAAWQTAIDARDQAMIVFTVLVITSAIVWLAWGRETKTRRRLMLTGWGILEGFFLCVGILATYGVI